MISKENIQKTSRSVPGIVEEIPEINQQFKTTHYRAIPDNGL